MEKPRCSSCERGFEDALREEVITRTVINEKDVVTLHDLNQIYIYDLEKAPHANLNHCSEKLKAKLEKSEPLANAIGFCQMCNGGKFASYIIYNMKMSVGEDVKQLHS